MHGQANRLFQLNLPSSLVQRCRFVVLWVSISILGHDAGHCDWRFLSSFMKVTPPLNAASKLHSCKAICAYWRLRIVQRKLMQKQCRRHNASLNARVSCGTWEAPSVCRAEWQQAWTQGCPAEHERHPVSAELNDKTNTSAVHVDVNRDTNTLENLVLLTSWLWHLNWYVFGRWRVLMLSGEACG